MALLAFARKAIEDARERLCCGHKVRYAPEAQIDHPHLHGSCASGTFSFETTTAPVARFVCHCLFCRDFTGELFSDASVLKGYQIDMKGTEALIHKTYRLPQFRPQPLHTIPQASHETMGAGPLKLVFVLSGNFVEQNLVLAVLVVVTDRNGNSAAPGTMH